MRMVEVTDELALDLLTRWLWWSGRVNIATRIQVYTRTRLNDLGVYTQTRKICKKRKQSGTHLFRIVGFHMKQT